jgi:tRNA G18 (ribose-2'-O)-methylase SpoU
MIGAIRTISSLDEPGLDLYRTLRRPLLHRKQGLFVAEGEKVVRRFLESGLPVLSVLMTPPLWDRHRELVEGCGERVEVFIAGKKLLEGIVGYECHQGIMAAGMVPPPLTLEAMVAASPFPRILLATDHLSSAENTGVLVRNGAAYGVHGLMIGETSADPWLRRSVRNSMGTIFRLPILYADNLAESLRTLRLRHGFRILGAHPRPGSRRLFEVNLSGDCCFVFGSEGDGISPAVLDACDETVVVPMVTGIDSLNVACASAAIIYEAVRQRSAPGMLAVHEGHEEYFSNGKQLPASPACGSREQRLL